MFDHNKYIISDFIDRIQSLIDENGKKIEYEPEYSRGPWELEYRYEYSPDIISEFKNAIRLLKQADIYIQRIDKLTSGEDSIETFRNLLALELSQHNQPTLWGGENGY
jgi:hypothetical protein